MNGDTLRQITPSGDLIIVMSDSSRCQGSPTVLFEKPFGVVGLCHTTAVPPPLNLAEVTKMYVAALFLGNRISLISMHPVDYQNYINGCLAAVNNPIVSSPPNTPSATARSVDDKSQGLIAHGTPLPKCECGASKCGGNHSDWCPVKG